MAAATNGIAAPQVLPIVSYHICCLFSRHGRCDRAVEVWYIMFGMPFSGSSGGVTAHA